MSGVPKGISRRDLVVTLAAIVITAALWHQVFAMTGVLWWNAPAGVATSAAAVPARQAPPRALVLKPPDATGVDLGAYLRTHPRWEP